MLKVKYEVDPFNRIASARKGVRNGLPQFRKVIDGRFKIDDNNSLSYLVKAPLNEGGGIPNQIKLNGKWFLDDNCDLRLTLDKSARETFGDEVTLQGEIIDASSGSLLFAVTTKTKEGIRSTYVLNLQGSWKADEYNRLSFRVRKEGGRFDILTFNGEWELDNKHQIVYRYEKTDLIRKKTRTSTLVFKGYWDIRDDIRISYVMDGNTDSVFNFEARSGVFKEDYIKYSVGIGLSGRVRPVKQTVTLYGEWKFKKNAGLVFEIEYEAGRVRSIVFGAEARLSYKNTVSFRLKSGLENKDIGANLELSRAILKGDGEMFLKLLKEDGEFAVSAGAACRW